MSKDRGYRIVSVNGKKMVEIDPDNVKLQDESTLVAKAIKDMIMTHPDLKDNQVSLVAVLLGLEYMITRFADSLEEQLNTPKGH